MTCACKDADCEHHADYKAKVDAIRFALQTMATDRSRDASDLIKRARTIHEFLIHHTNHHHHPGEGSQQGIGGLS